MLVCQMTAAIVKMLKERLSEACVLEQAKVTKLAAQIGDGEAGERQTELGQRQRRLKMLKDMVDNFQRLLDEPRA